MGIIGNFRSGRKFVKWLGEEILHDDLLVVETFYCSTVTSAEKRQQVVALALSRSTVYLSGLASDLKQSTWRRLIPIDSIQWLDVDARSVDYPWILESSYLPEAIELSSTGHGTRVPRILVELLLELTGLEVTIDVGDTRAVIEYIPWRPGSPGGWMAFRTRGDNQLPLDSVVPRIQAYYRGKDSLYGLDVKNGGRFPVPEKLSNEGLAHALLRSAGMPSVSEATIGLDEQGKPYLVGTDKQQRIAIIALPEETIAATPRPLGVIAQVDSVFVEMSLYSVDMNAITLRVPGYDKTVKIDGNGLDGDWEKLVAMSTVDHSRWQVKRPSPGLRPPRG